MFQRTLAPVCLALFALAACVVDAAPAHAGQYGSFVIHNTNDVPVKYYVQWGDDAWELYSVEPGAQNAHYMVLDANGMAPIPYVSFDNYGGDGRETLVTYEVDFFEVDSPHSGKDYSFVYGSDGRHIDLYEG